MAVGIGLSALAQFKPTSNEKANIKMPRATYKFDGTEIGAATPNVIVSNKAVLDQTTVQTKYDLQSNGNSPNHIYLYPDGTIGTTSVMGLDEANWPDRGTGYNYYNGTAWGAVPTTRIEPMKTGWPNYAPYGANGECVVAHQSGTTPIVFSKRDTKGSGAWTTTTIPNPAGFTAGMLWPRMITNGTDNMNIHIICLTAPTANGGALYNGMNGAILYTRSLDGGNTWDAWQQLDGMGPTDYLDFSADVYEWAKPHGNTLAFTFADAMRDFAIMKSTDNGDSWTKTVIWPCPYNFWTTSSDTTGIFYCPDSYVNATIDNNGNVHVASGLQRGMGDAAGTYWYPFTDGMLYWNETMPTWPEVLDPDWLDENGYIVGWLQDTMVWYQQTTELAYYYNSLSSFPTMVVDQANHLYLFWAGVTTYKDANSFMYRHIFARAMVDGVWRDAIVDVTDDFIYQFMECVYPTASPTCTMDKLQFQFMGDEEAGVFLKGSSGAQGQTAVTLNDMIFMEVDKMDIVQPGVGVDKKTNVDLVVNQNVPNPVRDITTIKVILPKAGNLSVEVFNTVGQKVMDISRGMAHAGTHHITLDASALTAGVYFYTVKADNAKVTKKMIVE